jgi:O-antigen ligase
MPRAVLLLLIAGSLAAFGGTYRWATLPLVGGGMVLFLTSYRTLQFRPSQRTLDIALVATAAVVLVQIVPLPWPLRDVLSPHAARVARVVQLVPAGDVSARPLSLDPGATLHGLGAITAAVMVFWAARGLLARGGLRLLTRGVAVIGAVAAGIALIQQAATPTLMYGFWEPGVVGAKPFGPFINRNHFAAWLILALPLSVGYFIAHVRIHMPEAGRGRGRWRAVLAGGGWLIVLAILLMLLALAASLSRSALVGLAAAIIVGWRLARWRATLGESQSAFLWAAATVVGLVIVATIDPEQLASRFTSTLQQSGTNRLTIWRETWPMIHDFWATGVGVGAYGVAMLVYQQTRVAMPHLQAGGWAHFNQAHSHYLQVLAEGGVLLALPVIVAMIAFARNAQRALASHIGEIEWIRIGAVASLTAIAVQSIWETALRMPANGVLAAVVAAIAVYHRDRQ